MIPPDRCLWTMPADSTLSPRGRCVADYGHDGGHIIAVPTRSAITYWSIVDETKRLAKAKMHVDLRDGSTFDDEECREMWAYFEAVVRVRKDLDSSS